MSNPNDPAYPTSDPTVDPRNPGWIGFGLTKREAFAMAAMQGLLADSDYKIAVARVAKEEGRDLSQLMASSAIEYADALLDELAKEGGQ